MYDIYCLTIEHMIILSIHYMIILPMNNVQRNLFYQIMGLYNLIGKAKPIRLSSFSS